MKNKTDYDNTHEVYTNNLNVYNIYDNLGRPPAEVSQNTIHSIRNNYLFIQLRHVLGQQLYIEWLYVNNILSFKEYKAIRSSSIDKFKIDTNIMDITTDEAKVR